MKETEKKLVQAAIRVFVRYGVRKTTMSDIATEAGVSRQTVYATFGNKNNVLAAAIGFLSDIRLEEVKAKWTELDDLGDKLDAYFEIAVIPAYDLIRQSPEADEMIGGYNEEGKAAFRAARERRSAAMARVLAPYADQIEKSGQSVDDFAKFFVITSTNFKYAVTDRDELLLMLRSLKVAVLAVTEGASDIDQFAVIAAGITR